MDCFISCVRKLNIQLQYISTYLPMCGQMEKSFQGDVNSYVYQQGLIYLCWG